MAEEEEAVGGWDSDTDPTVVLTSDKTSGYFRCYPAAKGFQFRIGAGDAEVRYRYVSKSAGPEQVRAPRAPRAAPHRPPLPPR